MAFYIRETAPKSEHESIAQQIQKFYFGDQPIGKENFQALNNVSLHSVIINFNMTKLYCICFNFDYSNLFLPTK